MVVKSSVFQAVQRTDVAYNLHCPGEDSIIIGPIKAFQREISEQENCASYFLHNGLVYLTVACPDLYHETLADEIDDTI
jgi:hypothetical protein